MKPTAVLLLSVWYEREHPTPLRARITQTGDVERPGTSVVAAGTADDICAVVKQWIEAFAARAPLNGRVPE